MKKNLLFIFFLSVFAITNSNAQWSACGSGLESSPRDMIVFNNELIVCNTDSAGGISVNQLAKWNGSNWSAFGGSGPDVGGITTLAVYNNKLVVAGYFTSMSGYPANCIAMWNGSSWDSLGSGINGSVYCMTVFNGDLIVGGNFYQAGGTNADHVARWNGTSWSAMDAGFDASVNALAVYNNELYAGGDFHRSVPDTMYYIAKWNGNDWDSIANDEFNGEVYALEVYNQNLYAGGDFDFNDSLNYIAYWDGNKWNGCDSGFDALVYDMAVYAGELYAGGGFQDFYDFSPANYIARWNGTSWALCGNGMNDEVDALCVYDGKLYAGGYFDIAGGINAAYIAEWTMPSGIDKNYADELVSVFPNPSDGKISFDLASSLPVTLEIFNALGEMVFSANHFETNSEIDLSELAPGIYFAQINFKDKQVRKKIVMQ